MPLRPCGSLVPLFTLLATAIFAAGAPGEESGGEGEYAAQVIVMSPAAGEVVQGLTEVSWEVLFFDMADGYAQVEMDGETVETPLPFDPANSLPFDQVLRFDARFGSAQPLANGAHTLRVVLRSLLGRPLAASEVNFTVEASPVPAQPSFNPGDRAKVRGDEWPIQGECGTMRALTGFPDVGTYTKRPTLVYACPPHVCGGSLDWLQWQEGAAARACGPASGQDGGCLWVDSMACHAEADVVILSCYASPPASFVKYPHQVWAFFCMESDTRRNLLPRHLLPYLDVVANYRLHGDVPLLAPLPHVHHVTVTYTPPIISGGLEESAEREGFAAYLVSNCGRPRDLFVARLIDALGPDRLHSYGRCLNNRRFPEEKTMGSATLALLRKYTFVIAVENYYSHDYVSERFYQPLITGTIPVYLGAPNIAEFAPGPHSFIDARAFPSPEALADHLIALHNDPQAIAALLSWRAHGPSASFARLMNASMTRGSDVYGEGRHHGCQHKVDLGGLQAALFGALSRLPASSRASRDAEEEL